MQTVFWAIWDAYVFVVVSIVICAIQFPVQTYAVLISACALAIWKA